jgi:hypothetical protein
MVNRVPYTCLGCSQTDDHPKHGVGLPDGSTAYWHNDCHATVTGCKVCSANAAQGLKGDELLNHIQENRPFVTLMDEEGNIDG